MHGRLNVTDDPLVHELFRYFKCDLGDTKYFLPLYNMGPSESVPIIFEREGKRTVKNAIWWFLLTPDEKRHNMIPNTRFKTFNAKADKLTGSKLWSHAFKARRCAVPANGYYEWAGDKHGKRHLYYIKPLDKAIAFAGLYNQWHLDHQIYYSFAIITTQAHPKLAHIHDKSLPVMLTPEFAHDWMNPMITDTEQFKPLFEPELHTDFSVTPVDPMYSKSSVKDSGCVEPVGEVEIIRRSE